MSVCKARVLPPLFKEKISHPGTDFRGEAWEAQ